MKKSYELIDHTADIGIKVSGRNEMELFANAGLALFDIMTDLNKVQERQKVEVQAEGWDREELLINWLRELLDCFHIKKLLLKKFEMVEASEIQVRGVACGEPIDFSRHIIRKEIKGATYHDLKVEKSPGGWMAQVIFDI